MQEVLALATRPKKLSRLLGQKSMVASIKKRLAQGRIPKAWMFSGETGAGKTTIARIIALSFQMDGDVFGEPGPELWDEYAGFDIREINASDINGVDDMRQLARDATYMPQPGSRKKVIILDEAHRLTSAAQNCLLKPFEDTAKDTVWIICTTEPGKIIKTLRGRCAEFKLKGLRSGGIKVLLKRAAKAVAYSGEVDKLVDILDEQGISSPRVILNVFEHFVHGDGDAAKAVQVGGAEVDGYMFSKLVWSRDWAEVAPVLREADVEQMRNLRFSVVGYLRAILLGTNNNAKTRVMAAGAIDRLSVFPPPEDGMFRAWFPSQVYNSIRFMAGQVAKK
jgi:hypothetical protein